MGALTCQWILVSTASRFPWCQDYYQYVHFLTERNGHSTWRSCCFCMQIPARCTGKFLKPLLMISVQFRTVIKCEKAANCMTNDRRKYSNVFGLEQSYSNCFSPQGGYSGIIRIGVLGLGCEISWPMKIATRKANQGMTCARHAGWSRHFESMSDKQTCTWLICIHLLYTFSWLPMSITWQPWW